MDINFLYILSWLVTFVISVITFIVVKHYLRVRSFPPGPFSYPIIGNFLEFRGKDTYAQHVFRNFGKKFNNLYTFWMGTAPCVIVTNWDYCKEALVTRKNDFSGRVIRPSTAMFTKTGSGVAANDYGPCWETLRKILVSAVRKYALSDKLADLVTDVVDRSVDSMLKEGKPVEALNYAYLIIYNILASSAFGQRYEMDDPEFVSLRKSSEEIYEEVPKILASDFFPMLSWFFRKQIQKVNNIMDKYVEFLASKYNEHKRTYEKGVVRDFTDALLLAKGEAEEESKECRQFVTDGNLMMVLSDLFSAGTDTTKTTLLWIFLIICDKPEIQRKMQAEIDENIGSRPPRQDDKHSCPYIQAVIAETLRYRPVLDTTLEHKTICNTELGGYKIPAGTACLFHVLNSHREQNLWEDAEDFKPERFLDEDGKFINKRFEGYMPFGIGRRACPGEKLALADVFLIITRLLQTVSLELENGPGSVDLTPELKVFVALPYKFNLVVKKRSST